MKEILGLDPALRHGALVSCQWEMNNHFPILKETRLLYGWTKKDKVSVGLEATAQDIQRLANSISSSIIEPNIIGIDWALAYSYGRTARAAMLRLAYFMGYLSRSLHGLGSPVVFIAPFQLRTALGLPKTCHKDQVWKAFVNEAQIDADIHTGKMVKSDVLDAVLLTYVIAKTLTQEGNNVGVASQIDLLS